ncbi:MAG TPA: hypothetical protein DIC34_09495 [Treponema sp.]|nr:MAG: hypothetical protein A2001_14490 [Treponema sp. GWC1_61_84]OHE76650.1 MAG: hypothetical protein A2413_03230 [Treponema sp. RIFOXYC1_FULL_61_9]HCM26761.1 hypothetical protein [Treponema sp.]
MKTFNMETTEKRSRLLGLAFLIQFVTSFTSGVIVLPRATGVNGFALPDSIGRTLANIARNAGLIQLTILMELVTAAVVIFLGAMLFTTVRRQHEGLALTAFGLYVLEGLLIAVKMLLLFALLVFSRQFIAAGNPGSLEPMGKLLYEVMGYSSKMLNFAFCLGGTVFYALLFMARTVSRPLSLWGLISTQGVLAGVVMGFFGISAPIYVYVPYIPFELVIALWILAKGVKKEEANY